MNEIEKARILNGKDRERTIERIELLEEINAEKDKKIKRLNNIINELDGYLDLKRKSYIEGFKWSGLEIIDQTKDFLQELKGSDK